MDLDGPTPSTTSRDQYPLGTPSPCHRSCLSVGARNETVTSMPRPRSVLSLETARRGSSRGRPNGLSSAPFLGQSGRDPSRRCVLVHHRGPRLGAIVGPAKSVRLANYARSFYLSFTPLLSRCLHLLPVASSDRPGSSPFWRLSFGTGPIRRQLPCSATRGAVKFLTTVHFLSGGSAMTSVSHAIRPRLSPHLLLIL